MKISTSFFSLLGGYLEGCTELHDPQQFQDAITQFVANRSVRVREPARMVLRVDQVRDWSHGKMSSWPYVLRKNWLHLTSLKCFLKGMGGPGAPHCFMLDRAADLRAQGAPLGPRTPLFFGGGGVCSKKRSAGSYT